MRVDLIIRWRIQRSAGAIEWRSFRQDLQAVLRSGSYADDVVKQFYFAVAQFHTGDITDANATFSGLRRLSLPALSPHAIRSYFIGPEGSPKRFQGTVERHHQNYYVLIPELNLSVPARVQSIEGGPGATVHPYIGFSLNGPVAVFDKPGERDSLLP